MKPRITTAKYLQLLTISILSRLLYFKLAELSSRLFTPFDKSTGLLTNESYSFLCRWDAIYFYEIINRGYTREHLTAFFPLFTFTIRIIKSILGSEIIFTSLIVNSLLFVLSSLIFYRITFNRYNPGIADISFMFFVFNPSSIVYLSLYSESLFTFLFLIGFQFLENEKTYKALFFLSLTTLTRSNGILFLFFFLDSLNNILHTILMVFFFLIPFITYQLYCYNLLDLQGFTIPYSYIQSKYWEQGFLRFYHYKKNIPNFIVGIPFILTSLYILASFAHSKLIAKGKITFNYFKDPKNKTIIVLFAILAVQTMLCIFFIHMQMFFRFISYNPIFYWCLAFIYEDCGWFFKILVYLYFFYGVAYAILFGSYYPPA